MLAPDPGADKVFVDVGCNTGADAVKWLGLWGMEGLPDRWNEAVNDELLKAGKRGAGGACHENVVRNESAAASFNPASFGGKLLCVEPMPSNVALLRRVNSNLFGQHQSPVEVIPVAVSDSVGTVPFDDGIAGRENIGIRLLTQDVIVNMTTVDSMVSSRGIDRVDVLTIDTEGHDPAVLRSAAGTLQRVRYLQFEVHEDLENTEWSKTTLLAVLSQLDGMLFDCYWPGNDGSLARLTGVWSQRLQDQAHPVHWSNVVCAKRADAWHEILEKHASLQDE